MPAGVELPKYFARSRWRLANASSETNWQKNTELEAKVVNFVPNVHVLRCRYGRAADVCLVGCDKCQTG